MLVLRTDGRVVKGNGLQNRTIVGSNPTPCSIWVGSAIIG
jgi:hypothetical protein